MSESSGLPPSEEGSEEDGLKPFDGEIVSGSVVWSVWKLSWPMVLLHFVNALHGLVDHILVGHFVPSEENAANAGVGIAWQVFLVLVVLISSLYHGMNVLVARYAGKRDRRMLSHIVYQNLLCSVLILMAVGPIGYLAAPHMLRLVNAEPVVMAHALPYIRILFVFGAPLFLMFMMTGAMQASGDPRTPLMLGVLATALNIILSSVLITGAGPFPKLGTSGAALATCLAAAISAVLALMLTARRKLIIQPPPRLTLRPDLAVLRQVVRIGLPTGIQAVLLNLGGVFLLAFIGTLENSAAAQAAYTICYSQLFALVLRASWGLRNAASTVLGQNIGAGSTERGVRGVHVAALLGVGWASLMGLCYVLFPGALMALFKATEDPVFPLAASLLRYLAVSGVFLASALAYTGGLAGAGETKKPMFIALITQIGILLGLCEMWWMLGMLTPTAIWSSIVVSHAVRLLLSLAVFLRGKWRSIEVEVRESGAP